MLLESVRVVHTSVLAKMKTALLILAAIAGVVETSSFQAMPDTAIAEPLRLLLEVSCLTRFQPLLALPASLTLFKEMLYVDLSGGRYHSIGGPMANRH